MMYLLPSCDVKGKNTRLVSVDGVGEVFDAEESLVGFGDWDVMEM
jgi:hypothetical protein